MLAVADTKELKKRLRVNIDMARKGYQVITVSDALHTKLKAKATSMGLSMPQLIRNMQEDTPSRKKLGYSSLGEIMTHSEARKLAEWFFSKPLN